MDPIKQRIAIAEACGWKHYGCTGCAQSPCACDEWIHESTDGVPSELPDYLNDLNAMHEAEKSLDVTQHLEFPMELRCIIQRDCNKPECYIPGAERSQLIADYWFYHATAAQRAEAFLRTLGLWE